jgi:hypothetical protein
MALLLKVDAIQITSAPLNLCHVSQTVGETNVGTLGFLSSPALYIFMFFNLGECLIYCTCTSGAQGR